MSSALRIAFVTPEMEPFVKTGGLADVSGALPKALAKLGHDVTVFLPRYREISFPAGVFLGSAEVAVDANRRSAEFYETKLASGVRVVFVEHGPFFDRPGIYDWDGVAFGDNRLRFAFLARAVLEFYRTRSETPDVFHCHDWQTGLLPVYLKTLYLNDPKLGHVPTLFTIHNLAYQGNFARDTVSLLGLPWHLARGGGLEFYGAVSYLKGGILFSEHVSTVSPQYAREIQDSSVAHGMDVVIRSRAADLSGILNGVDYEEWDPRADRHIAQCYSLDDLSGKAACKADLLRSFGLPTEPDLPVIGVISRLVHQKGFDLVVGSWYDFVQRPLRLIVLGTGDSSVEAGFREMSRRAPDRIAARFHYDQADAHRIEAGSDMFLMPSRYEPCGLTQMYSLRYGTPPIARATGGLVDTIEPYDAASGKGTGFLFANADGTGLIWAVDQALAVYRDTVGWRGLMRNGMSRDFSWDRSAQSYTDLYRRLVSSRVY